MSHTKLPSSRPAGMQLRLHKERDLRAFAPTPVCFGVADVQAKALLSISFAQVPLCLDLSQTCLSLCLCVFLFSRGIV